MVSNCIDKELSGAEVCWLMKLASYDCSAAVRAVGLVSMYSFAIVERVSRK